MRERLAHIVLRGPIRERNVDPIVRILKALRTRRRFRGVLFDVSSGGGESVASTDLSLALQRLDQTTPVFAAVGSVAASGAYLAALGARRVFAYPESIVGSIGVIFPHLAVRELARRLGVSVDLLHVGAHKDAFQGYRPLTDVERAKMLAVAQESYDGFVARVATARHRPVEEIRALATGEVWSGRRALELGLIDELGDREHALTRLSELTGVPVARTVRLAPPRPFLERLLAGPVQGSIDGVAGAFREAVEDAVLDLGAPMLRR
ncbi:MAG TPA: signal peptide peptidase SppA [Thermoplasmata archaeon]|nr:signal peptide peptidase SppA [Thermoplasmata archaeon]